MGQVADQSRVERFIEEFQEDILRVYGLPRTPWIKGQWLEDDISGGVRVHIEFELEDGSRVRATLECPVFYDPHVPDRDNVEAMEEAMDVRNGLDRADIVARLKKTNLISGAYE